ncbi:MAG: hypothetical protein ACLGSA_11915 [Acidobacteriota bacterium]
MAETTSFFSGDEPAEHLYTLPPDHLPDSMADPLYDPGGFEAAPPVEDSSSGPDAKAVSDDSGK